MTVTTGEISGHQGAQLGEGVGGETSEERATSDATRQLVADYIRSVGEGRFDRVEQLLHPDVTFDGTAKELRGAAEYLGALRRLSPIIVRNDIREIVVEGDRAVVVYNFVTDTEVGAVLSAESLVIEEGRIRSVTLLFDWRRWPEVVAELSRRSQQPASSTT